MGLLPQALRSYALKGSQPTGTEQVGRDTTSCLEARRKRQGFSCSGCLKDGFPVSSASDPGVEKLARCQKAAGEDSFIYLFCCRCLV